MEFVKHKKQDNDKNEILKLFGRETYPGSVQWEYYTTIFNGIDPIKIPIRTRQNELYHDDMIYIDALNCKYKIQLHRYDGRRYYPDLL